ncbi:MAG: radical SAM protein [Nanoarchaeota archaeon]|nr:radical SAM protein [Nanoarchaeota archaeon]
MKVLLVYPPFCSPVSPPYSLTNLYSAIKNNSDYDVGVLDLNIVYHRKRFPLAKEAFQEGKDVGNYFVESREVYSVENKKVVNGEDPEYLKEFVNLIVSKKVDYIAFSIVYSSQVFYAYALLKALEEKGVKCFVGGPAVNHKLLEVAKFLKDEEALFEEIGIVEKTKKKVLDFSIYKDYFIPEIVVPIKTVSACYYQQCTFCTHHGNRKYEEFSLEDVKETLIKSKAKKVFIIDDMNHKQRLLDLAKIMKELKVEWMCQLRPDNAWDKETLEELYSSGLRVVMWGVESGCDRVLNLIKKRTNVKDIESVLKSSKEVGVKNVAFMIFGFPSETEQEFLESVSFLERNSENIDLVLSATFGLQEGAPLYENPEEFGIVNVQRKERTILAPTISYVVSSGLSQEEAEKLKKKCKARINSVNKVPKWMNIFREHMLFL